MDTLEKLRAEFKRYQAATDAKFVELKENNLRQDEDLCEVTRFFHNKFKEGGVTIENYKESQRSVNPVNKYTNDALIWFTNAIANNALPWAEDRTGVFQVVIAYRDYEKECKTNKVRPVVRDLFYKSISASGLTKKVRVSIDRRRVWAYEIIDTDSIGRPPEDT